MAAHLHVTRPGTRPGLQPSSAPRICVSRSTHFNLPGNPHCSFTSPVCAADRARRQVLVAAGRASAAAYRGPESFPQPTGCEGPAADDEDPVAALEKATEEVQKLVQLLPPRMRVRLEDDPRLSTLIEIVMDLGRPPLARFPDGDVHLADEPVDHSDLRNRAGRVVGLTCRVGRAIQGSAAMVADLAAAGKSILLLGRPGVGKTTAIREISRFLADSFHKRVVIVDTSNEIGGDGDIPHPGVGGARRMQVPLPEEQHRVMIEAVENHMPEVIVIDEIGTEAEALAARTIAQRGVQLVATAHGNELENVMKNPSLNDLVGGINSVTLGDEEAKRRGVQKSILERASPPTFDATVEMVSRTQWRVHLDVAASVDALLLGDEAGAEVRERDSHGQVWAWPEDEATDVRESDDEATGMVGPGSRPTARGAREGAQSAKSKGQRLHVETQPFPEAALRAARAGAAPASADGSPPVARPSKGASSSGNGSSSIIGSSTSGRASSKATALKVFLYGVDEDSVQSVVEALGLAGSLGIAAAVQDADAVLATRAKLKTSGWVRGAATAARVPIYTVRSASVDHVVKAIRTLLGIDPSPGGMFAAAKEDPAGADPKVSSSRTLRAETSIALVNQAGRRSTGSDRGALEEARAAIEGIVLKQGQPAELAPREAHVIRAQLALAQQYHEAGLRYELAGEEAAGEARGNLRLRLLPPGWEDGKPAARAVVDVAAAVENT